MQRIRWGYLLLALSLPDAWAQQATTPAQPSLVDLKTVPAAQSQPPQPSEKNHVRACPGRFEFHPELDGIYKVGNGVEWPKPTHEVDAVFSDEARQMIKKAHLKAFGAVSLVSLVVDASGNPQDLCVMKAAGFGLDEQAIMAAEQFRFKPATKDGSPVAVRISIEMNFKLH
jgi:protein TonB